MLSKDQTYKIIKDTLLERGADFIGIFGSFARNEEKPESDIDVLVSFKESAAISLLDRIGIQIDLEEKIGRKIDMGTRSSLSKYVAPFVMKDLIILHESHPTVLDENK
jgi:predicted nucleotidyltransferase